MSVLHIIATPIGNLEDVTLRALRVLGEVKLVLAEDTRRTRVLLDRHSVDARPVSLHAHNEAARVDRALSVLDAGGDVALVSDAGTPLVSDPGERLVRAVVDAGHAVSPVPGASAVLSALSVAGLPAAPFTFVGFLPRKKGERDRLLGALRERTETLVFFESPRRVANTLRQLCEILGDREACAARELTKLHEQVARGTLSELAARFDGEARGEFTLVVAGAGEDETHVDPEALDAAIRRLLAEGHPTKEIAERLSGAGHARRDVYARVVALKGSEK